MDNQDPDALVLERRRQLVETLRTQMPALSSDEIASRVVAMLIGCEGNLNRYQTTLEIVLDAHRLAFSPPPQKTGNEKLAICINALRKIAGDPAVDPLVQKATGEDPATLPSVRAARVALSLIGASMSAPTAQGETQ